MFIISLTYKVPLEQVETHFEAHMTYIKEQYALGHFHASGKKVPRTGGVILSQMKDRAALEAIVQEDPFCIHDLVEVEITEFIPSKASENLQGLLEV